MEGFWTVLLIAFVGLIIAPGESRSQNSPFDAIDQLCPGVENDMKKCVKEEGISMKDIMSLQSDPAKVQELKGKMKDLCTSDKFSGLMDCYFDAMKDKCSAQQYKQISMFMSKDKMIEFTKFMCDNLDALTDAKLKTCMESLATATSQQAIKSCAEARAKELRDKIKEAPQSEQALALTCYTLDLSMSCMKPQLKTCPKGGEVVTKMIFYLKPKGCEDYTLAAGMMKPSILMVFVITAFSLFFGYAY